MRKNKTPRTYDELMRMQEDEYYELFTGGNLKSRWKHMKERCENPKRKDYKYYGGKGVAVCEAWHDYRTFRKWFYYAMISEGSYNLKVLVIDRRNPNEGYYPDNCHLVTVQENARRSIKGRNAKGQFIKA